MASGRQSDISANTSRSLEAGRIVDRRLEAERGDRADTRHGHDPSDLSIITCQLQNLTIEIVGLLWRSLLVPLGLVFGGRLGDPWAHRGDRGSGFARARKQSQAVIIGGVGLEAAPPSACHDHAQTISVLVNSRKRL